MLALFDATDIWGMGHNREEAEKEALRYCTQEEVNNMQLAPLSVDLSRDIDVNGVTDFGLIGNTLCSLGELDEGRIRPISECDFW